MRTFYFSFILLAACPYVYAFLFVKNTTNSPKNIDWDHLSLFQLIGLGFKFNFENAEELKLLKKSLATNCGLTQLERLVYVDARRRYTIYTKNYQLSIT